MAKHTIKSPVTNLSREIEADWYRKEDDFFVFYGEAGADRSAVVLTFAAQYVASIETVSSSKA